MRKDKNHLPKGWSIKKLGEIFEINSGTTPSRLINAYFENGNHLWVKTTDLNNQYITNTEEKVTDLAMIETSLKKLPIGTVLVAMYGGYKQIGRTGLLKKEASVNQALSAIIPNYNVIEPEYLLNWLNCKVEDWKNFAASSRKDPNITKSDVLSFPIVFPPLPEQKKIAQILSTWNEALQTTQELIKKLEKRKIGLMQRLLSGKSNNRKTYQIMELLKQVKRPVKWNDDELYHLISVRRRSGGAFFRESLMGRQILIKDLYTAKKGDFLISKMQISHGASGLVIDTLDNMKVSGSYISLVAKNPDLLEIIFFDWYSRQRSFYHLCYTSSYGVHIEKMTFDFDTFLKRKITIPPIEEQKAIVNILNTAEAELKETRGYLEKLKVQKKGLMQQLLTGKIRVRID